MTGTLPVNNSLLTGTVPVNNSLLTGTVPVNNSLLIGTVPVTNSLLTRTVLVNNSLLTGTVPVDNSLFARTVPGKNTFLARMLNSLIDQIWTNIACYRWPQKPTSKVPETQNRKLSCIGRTITANWEIYIYIKKGVLYLMDILRVFQ